MSSTELNIDDFIAQANSDVPSANRVIVNEGEYTMFVKPGSTKLFEGVSEKNGKRWKMYTAVAVIDSADAREQTNLEEPTARVSFLLDVTDSGELQIGTNRNVTLGKLLEATGNRKPEMNFGRVRTLPEVVSRFHFPLPVAC